ncbi:MAG: aldehyde dehydrogenase family protein, partial [Anaerolineales bacterium]
MVPRMRNYINGEWRSANGTEVLQVVDPARQVILADVIMSTAADIDAAAQAAAAAFSGWRRTPAPDRIQYLFRLKMLLE